MNTEILAEFWTIWQGLIADLMRQYGTDEIIGESQVLKALYIFIGFGSACPCSLVLIGIVALLLGALETRESGIPVWKSSSLPFMSWAVQRSAANCRAK